MTIKKSNRILDSIKKKKDKKAKEKKPNKIKFKSVDTDSTEIIINGKLIGIVKRGFSFKWIISTSFSHLIEDSHLMKLEYDNDIEAGRELANMFFRYKEALAASLGSGNKDYSYNDMFGNIGF